MSQDPNFTKAVRTSSNTGEPQSKPSTAAQEALTREQVKLLEDMETAGKNLSPWHHFEERIRTLSFKRATQARDLLISSFLEKERAIEIYEESLPSDSDKVDRQKEKAELAENLVGVWLRDQREKGVPGSEMLKEEAIRFTPVDNERPRKIWFYVLLAVAGIEAYMGYVLLSTAAEGEGAPFHFEYLAAAMMGLIFVLTVKFSKAWFKDEQIVKFSKLGLVLGILSFISYIVLVRAFISVMPASKLPDFVKLLEPLSLIGATLLIPVAGALLIDRAFQKKWNEDDHKKKFITRFKALIDSAQHEEKLHQEAKEALTATKAHIHHLKREVAELKMQFQSLSSGELSAIENEENAILEASKDAYEKGLNSLEALQYYTPEARKKALSRLNTWTLGRELAKKEGSPFQNFFTDLQNPNPHSLQ